MLRAPARAARRLLTQRPPRLPGFCSSRAWRFFSAAAAGSGGSTGAAGRAGVAPSAGEGPGAPDDPRLSAPSPHETGNAGRRDASPAVSPPSAPSQPSASVDAANASAASVWAMSNAIFRENVASSLALGKLLLAAAAAMYAIYFAAHLYIAQFDVRKMWLRCVVQHRRFWRFILLGDCNSPHAVAEKNSQASLPALPQSTCRLASTYFLQLDNDKPNGVKRIDVIKLLEEAGINADNSSAVRNFGKGAGALAVYGGASLKAFLSLLNELASERGSKEGKSDGAPRAGESEGVESGEEEEGQPQFTKLESLLITKIKEQNTAATNRIYLDRGFGANDGDESADAELAWTQDALARARRTRDGLLARVARLGPGERERLRALEEEIRRMENEIALALRPGLFRSLFPF